MRREHIVSCIAVVVVILLAGAFWHASAPKSGAPAFAMSDDYIRAVGPVQAQKEAWQLSQEGSTTVDGHMFLHVVGQYIFNTYGPKGIAYCEPYFDHGCYNGFMMHITSVDTLTAALAACNDVSTYTLGGCIHGAGHAATLINNYDVPKALALCSTLNQNFGTSTLSACSFGVFMESDQPGVMDNMTQMSGMGMAAMTGMDMSNPANNTAGNANWMLKKSDPSFPCDSPLVDTEYRAGCWRMQMVILANNLPLSQSIGLCNGLPSNDQKSACFIGFADGFTNGPHMDLTKIDSACGYATGSWKDTCLIDFVQRAYLNGYGSTVPNTMCSQIDAAGKNACAQMQANMQKLLSH